MGRARLARHVDPSSTVTSGPARQHRVLRRPCAGADLDRVQRRLRPPRVAPRHRAARGAGNPCGPRRSGRRTRRRATARGLLRPRPRSSGPADRRRVDLAGGPFPRRRPRHRGGGSAHSLTPRGLSREPHGAPLHHRARARSRPRVVHRFRSCALRTRPRRFRVGPAWGPPTRLAAGPVPGEFNRWSTHDGRPGGRDSPFRHAVSTRPAPSRRCPGPEQDDEQQCAPSFLLLAGATPPCHLRAQPSRRSGPARGRGHGRRDGTGIGSGLASRCQDP